MKQPTLIDTLHKARRALVGSRPGDAYELLQTALERAEAQADELQALKRGLERDSSELPAFLAKQAD